MAVKAYPVIDPVATGENIRRLRVERGMTVRELQGYFGFEEPRAIYKWQKGESLPTVDNLYALSALFEVPMEQIIIPLRFQLYRSEQQAGPAAHVISGCFGCGRGRYGACQLLRRAFPPHRSVGRVPENRVSRIKIKTYFVRWRGEWVKMSLREEGWRRLAEERMGGARHAERQYVM